MNAAQNLFQSLCDFGWPIVAYAIFVPIGTFLIPSGHSRGERAARLLLVGAIIALIDAFFFIGTESSDILQVTRIHPAWGGYVGLLAVIAIGSATKWAVQRVQEHRTVISLTSPSEMETSRSGFHIVAVVGWLIASVLGVFWLLRIAHG